MTFHALRCVADESCLENDADRSSNAIVNLLDDILHLFENVVCVPSSILAAYATVFSILFIEIDLEIIALPVAAILTSEMFLF